MRNLRNVFIGFGVLSLMAVTAYLVYFYSKDSCPVGTFSCSASGHCVHQRDVCNIFPNCPDGDDEDAVLCTDLHGSTNMIDLTTNNITVNQSLEFIKSVNDCAIVEYPSSCLCKYSYRIFCKGVGLYRIPGNISTTVTHLILANNTIRYLSFNSFSGYNDLKLIHLEGNGLEYIAPGVFKNLNHLERLFIMDNSLTRIQKGVFPNLSSLLWLFLDNNQLEHIYIEDFRYLTSLQWLDLSNNKLTLENVSFPSMLSLQEVFIDNNRIKTISKYTFARMANIEYLGLRSNLITHIDPEAFSTLLHLTELDLYDNKLAVLAPNVFQSQGALTKIYLGMNPFQYIPSELFHPLIKLASLNLEEILIENIDIEMFSTLKNLQSVYFKKYSYCAYAPTVPRCRPLSDGISNINQLLFKPIFRYATWLICFTTCIGNALVLWGRFVFRDENKSLSLVIRNLAVSDFLMGLYLLIIAIHDLKFRDKYNFEAFKWMSSWTCTITGMVGMVSCEVSVLLLLFMSIDRFLLIAVPFGNRYGTLNIKETVLILTVIWIVGIIVALIPVLEFYSSTRFYGVNGLCFPLYITDPYLLGWEFSAAIFFGINATSLLVIGVAYVGMFISIWKTRNATSLPIKDFEIAVRFFFIVLTDACCWLPIIYVKASAFFGAEISVDLYGWLVVFILPINSALNPLLYTFTTPKYRAQIYRVPTCIKDVGNGKRTSRTPPQSGGDTGSFPMASRNGFTLKKSVFSQY